MLLQLEVGAHTGGPEGFGWRLHHDGAEALQEFHDPASAREQLDGHGGAHHLEGVVRGQ